MTDAEPAGKSPAATTPPGANPPAEWKPEPRQWSWKDLFTAPMLAFKPKCMAVSALTLLLLGVIAWGFSEMSADLGNWYWPVYAAFLALSLAVFGAGATLVAVFLKADLLDDEFLSLGEALGQFKGRVLPAILVPVFLAVLVVGVHGLTVWLPLFISSIPYAGGFIYGLLYILFFAAAVFCVLLVIAVSFSLFVFPAIVAIRRHGWFDNVVDTIEAVGTRPHILVASLLLTGIFIAVTLTITDKAERYLQQTASKMPAWGEEAPDPARVERRAQEISSRAAVWLDLNNAKNVFLPGVSPQNFFNNVKNVFLPGVSPQNFFETRGANPYATQDSFVKDTPVYQMGSGLIGGFWQTLLVALIFGYCLNLFIGGGMLTYLMVREDDYWDDEDLEDLHKLANEHEEEAKREEQHTPAAAEPTKPA